MIKILSLFMFLPLFAFAKPIVMVSILPQQTFVQKIAKDKVDVHLMVQPGSSPHSYEPKASQMVALSKADLYFSIGVEFENVWIERFKSQNPSLAFIDMGEGITKLAIQDHHHGHEHHNHNHKQALDPHIWTTPANVAMMAHTIYNTLKKVDPKNKAFYKTNLDLFLEEIQDTDTKIQALFKDLAPKSKFLVFHPSWGYFASQYNLIQVAVEVNGKKPKPQDIINIMREARDENVRVIFAQPEFSDQSARVIANGSKLKVHKISPLSPNWSENLIEMAEAIANK